MKNLDDPDGPMGQTAGESEIFNYQTDRRLLMAIAVIALSILVATIILLN